MKVVLFSIVSLFVVFSQAQAADGLCKVAAVAAGAGAAEGESRGMLVFPDVPPDQGPFEVDPSLYEGKLTSTNILVEDGSQTVETYNVSVTSGNSNVLIAAIVTVKAEKTVNNETYCSVTNVQIPN